MIEIMKAYNKAELQILRMNNNDIVTTSNIPTSSNPVTGSGQIQTPGRRSIWD